MVNDGPLVDEVAQKKMIDNIKNSKDMEYLLISGSLSKGINPEYYEEILEVAKNNEVKIILDISSKKLDDLLKYKPFLIKPNGEEIKDIFNLDLDNEKEIIYALKFLHNKGAQNILITLGALGSYFYNGEKIFHSGVKEIIQVSSACAGDSYLAGFISVWINNEENIESAMKLAAAIGADVAENCGIGKLTNVNEYIKNIHIKEII